MMTRYLVKTNSYPSRRTETYSIIDTRSGKTIPGLPSFVHREAADAYASRLESASD